MQAASQAQTPAKSIPSKLLCERHAFCTPGDGNDSGTYAPSIKAWQHNELLLLPHLTCELQVTPAQEVPHQLHQHDTCVPQMSGRPSTQRGRSPAAAQLRVLQLLSLTCNIWPAVLHKTSPAGSRSSCSLCLPSDLLARPAAARRKGSTCCDSLRYAQHAAEAVNALNERKSHFRL